MITLNNILDGYQLTTAEILYHLPDHPQLLQVFIWQDYDRPPHFPHLKHFLEFWIHKIDGKLYSVRVESAPSFIFPTYRGADFYTH